MRTHIWLFLIVLGLAVVGCAPVQPAAGGEVTATRPAPTQAIPTQTPSPTETESPSVAEIPEFLIPARNHLAQSLDIPIEQIVLVRYEPRNFRDGCLEVAQPGEMCLTVITPGYRAVFDTPKGEYVYHTTESGEYFRLAALPAAIIWERSGGIAGICQRLQISLNGSYEIEDCATQTRLTQGVLPLETFPRWMNLIQQYGSFEWQVDIPPDSADMFLDRYTFSGLGEDIPDQKTQEKINEMLVELTDTLLNAPSEPGAGVDR